MLGGRPFLPLQLGAASLCGLLTAREPGQFRTLREDLGNTILRDFNGRPAAFGGSSLYSLGKILNVISSQGTRSWYYSSVAEHLPRIRKTLSSMPNTAPSS